MFSRVMKNWTASIWIYCLITKSGQMNDGRLDFSGAFIRFAIGQVHGALSWFIRLYKALVELSASMQRLEQTLRAQWDGEIDAAAHP